MRNINTVRVRDIEYSMRNILREKYFACHEYMNNHLRYSITGIADHIDRM